MWNKVYLLVLDDRGAPLRDCIRSYKRRYNIDNTSEVNIRNVIDNGGCTGNELSGVTINDKLIVISHSDSRYLRAQKLGFLSPFEFVELLYNLGLKEVGIISFKCCYLGAGSYLDDINNELFSDIKVGYMSAYKRSAVTIFGHEGVGIIDSLVRLASGGLLKLPDRWRVNFVRGNTQAPGYSGKRVPRK
ncbi:hypothetical protein K5Z09_004566 [Escherichia coli]|nr:hypothetical protein [Escherichia coli]EHR8987298.1 hypothetical protein [Escherichia coli]EHR9096819.1 hypothetical protein [Escherichia coli]EHR9219371.1 hypothetical protein [Escherichia coli]EIM2921058.1 hypothetical protein [Escherichia coli]